MPPCREGASLVTACGLYALVLLVSAGCDREAGHVADATRAGGAPLGLFIALAAGHGRPRR